MKHVLQFAQRRLAQKWRILCLYMLAIGAIVAMLTYRLTSLTGGLSTYEVRSADSLARSPDAIFTYLRSPDYLPHDILTYLLSQSPLSTESVVRAVSVLLGVIGIFGFYLCLRRFCSTYVSVMGMALLATSTWFLHSARYASVDSTYLLIPLIFALFLYITSAASKRHLLALTFVCGLGIYVPGMIWLLLCLIIWKRKALRSSIFNKQTWFVGVMMLSIIILFIPLVLSSIQPQQGYSWYHQLVTISGFSLEAAVLQNIPNHAWQAFASIFISHNGGSTYTLGRLPWLDIGTIVLVVIGVYRLIRRQTIAAIIRVVLCCVFVMILLGVGTVSPLLLMPVVYGCALYGIHYLTTSWLRVFPRNPLVKSVGYICMTLLVASICSYNTLRYFVAWPAAPETHTAYSHHALVRQK